MLLLDARAVVILVGLGFLSHVQVSHHRLEPFPFFLQLDLELADDLNLNPDLGRVLVIEDMFRSYMLQEGRDVFAVTLAARPHADSVVEEGMLSIVIGNFV